MKKKKYANVNSEGKKESSESKKNSDSREHHKRSDSHDSSEHHKRSDSHDSSDSHESRESQSRENDENEENTPFFMFVSWQSSHASKEAPIEYLSMYGQIDADFEETQAYPNGRVAFQAQTTALDDVMKTVVTYLKEKGMWDDTLIVFTSDNGADSSYGDNYPLRGEKKNFVEWRFTSSCICYWWCFT